MSDKRDWLAPWVNLASFLNVVLSHTVAASALIGILYFGQLVTVKYMHAEETIWLKGTNHQFAASDLFNASDFAIILLFIVSGIYHGFEELRKK